MPSGNLLRSGLIVLRLLVFGWYGQLLAHGPPAPKQLPSHGHHALVGGFPTGAQLAIPCTPPDLGLPTEVLDRCGVFCASEVERPAHLCWGPIGPGACNQSATGRGIPGVGQGPLAAALAHGVCCGKEAPKFHACSGGSEARQVSELGPGGDGDRELDAAQGLEGCDHGGEAPGFAPFLACLCETLEAFRVCGHGADLFLQDDWLRRGGAHHRRAPPERGRVPGGPARRPEVVPEQKGLETALGLLESAAGLCACPGAIAPRFLCPRGDRDRGESPRARQAGQWHGVSAVCFAPLPGLCGQQRGGHDPAIRAFCRQRALEAGAARTGCVDEAQMVSLGRHLAEEWSNGTLAGAHGTQVGPLGAMRVSDLRHGNRLLVPVHPDKECARLRQGGPPSMLG
jgi:hypothetical protein